MCAFKYFRFSTLEKSILLSDGIRGGFYGTRSFKSSSKVVPPKIKPAWKKLLAATLAGVGFGTYYTLNTNYRKEIVFNKEEKQLPVIKELPDVKISRMVIYPYDTLGLDFVLFQYPTCPFCCKVRAFLDYYGLSYKVVEVNPVMRQQIKWTEYKKVPILLVKVEDEYIQLNDSSMIISAISTFLNDKRSGTMKDITKYYPTLSYVDNDGSSKNEILNRYFIMSRDSPDEESKQIGIEERKWRKWADDVLVHVLSPNVYRSATEAVDAFKWFSVVGDWDQHFSVLERQVVVYVGALAMWIIGKKLKNKYNLKDDVRESLYDECNVWLKELERKGVNFHGGNHPDLADLAVYGVLNSIEGCDAFRDVLKQTSLSKWYFDVKKHIERSGGTFTYLHSRTC